MGDGTKVGVPGPAAGVAAKVTAGSEVAAGAEVVVGGRGAEVDGKVGMVT